MTRIPSIVVFTTLIIMSSYVEAVGFGKTINLNCGNLDSSKPVSKDVYKSPHVHMFFHNQAKSHFFVVDLEAGEMHGGRRGQIYLAGSKIITAFK